MTQRQKKLLLALFIVLGVLFIDQAIKFWVKTHMYLGEASDLNWGWKIHWFRIIFVENEGMAFGIKFPTAWGKLILTSLRIIVSLVMIWYIIKVSKLPNVSNFYIAVLALILGGALGNLIDSIFYGVIFSESPYITQQYSMPPAQFLPPDGGYGKWFYGSVVDMFQFPLFDVHIPEWVPYFGGYTFTFFEPVFNFADASIFIGVVFLLFFGKKFLNYNNNESLGN